MPGGITPTIGSGAGMRLNLIVLPRMFGSLLNFRRQRSWPMTMAVGGTFCRAAPPR